MRTKRMLALALAGVMAAGLLCGCPWHDAPSSSSGSSSTSTRRPTGSGSDDSDDDDDDTPVVEETTYTEEDENGNTVTITEGDGFTRTENETTKEVSYTVTNAAGLVKWGTEVRGGTRDIDCTLANDIDMAGVDWTPIGAISGSDGNSYQGTFDGNGHSISNLTVTSTTGDCGGLFGAIELGCVKNLTMSNAKITAGNNTGGITGMLGADSQITGCTVTGSTITATTNDAGGIVGILASGGEVIGCMVSNSTIKGVGAATCHAGGIVGSTSYREGNESIIACCSVNNKGTATDDTIGFCGIVGDISLSSSDSPFIFQSCYWSGSAANVADIRHPTSTGYVEYQDNYTGAFKIGSEEAPTWDAANIELQKHGYTLTIVGGEPTGISSVSNANLFGLSLPF